MKILNLEIKNIRGIKTIKIDPEGHNVVVFGPNGTGKSALVDAVDFLLTGRISRLVGEGAKFLRLKEHGCHVDSRDDLRNTVVIAKAEVEGKTVVLERSIERPSSLKVEPEQHKDLVEGYLEGADLGLHILSRRDILNYITAEAGKRAKQVMSLLNLMDIEKLRSAFVSIRNDAESNFKYADSNLEKAKSEVANLLSLSIFSEEACLDKVNGLREELNGSRISELSPESIKENIEPRPFGFREDALTTNQIMNTIDEIRLIIKSEETIKKEVELRTLLEEVSREAQLRQYLLYDKLLETGLALLDGSNLCPLCGKVWEDGDFREYLRKKKDEIEIAKENQVKIDEISRFIKSKIDVLTNDINTSLKAHKQFSLEVIYEKEMKDYLDSLTTWSEAMVKPVEFFEKEKWPTRSLTELFSSSVLETAILDPLDSAIDKVGVKFSKQQVAWDTLTKMEDKWRIYIESLEEKKASEKTKTRADLILSNFEQARDSVLEGIYDEVRNNFERYYKTLHSEDEYSFSSKISHEEAELIFEVNFYGRGMFPPHALHSEGHQDSMGLCLFFALNKYLIKDAINMIILDDVIMSIDRGHRRNICALLKDAFPDKQLIITTHDTTWARQLKSEGLVTRKNMIHFLNWNIETGPIIEMEKDLWDKIKEDLEKDDAPSAAHKLRRNAECFFDDVCDFLRATGLPYKATHQWDLGEFASAAISTYKKYLRRAVVNSKKMDQQEKLCELEKLEKEANEVISRSLIEQWAINRNVHYDRWEEFGKRDFEPVVCAFKDLFKLFACSSCGSMITRIDSEGETPMSLIACNCGKVFWNIQ